MAAIADDESERADKRSPEEVDPDTAHASDERDNGRENDDGEDEEENLRHERLRAELDELDKVEDELKKKLANLGSRGSSDRPGHLQDENADVRRSVSKPTQRDKKMFGMLVGTLRQAKKDWSQFSSSNSQKKRSEAEHRAQEREEEERKQLMKKQEQIWEARKKKEAELTKLRDKRQTLNKLYGEERGYLRQIATSEKYIRTKAEPRVLWKPKMHNEKTRKAQEEGRGSLLGDAEERLVEVRETIAKCKTELNESREILSDMRKVGFRENRKQRPEDANMRDDRDVEKNEPQGERGQEKEHTTSEKREHRGDKAAVKRKRSSEAEEDVEQRELRNTSNEAHNAKAQRAIQEGRQVDSPVAKPKRRRATRDTSEQAHDSKDEMQTDERDVVVESTALPTPDDRTIEVEMETLSKDKDSVLEGNATSVTPMNLDPQVNSHESVRSSSSPDDTKPGHADKDASKEHAGELSIKKTPKRKDTEGKETIDEQPKRKDEGEEMPKPENKGEETPEPVVVPEQVQSDVKIESSPPNVQEEQPANEITHSHEPPGALTSDKDPKYADISAWTVKKLRAELAGRGVKHSKIKQKKGLIEALQEELRKPI
ncbi:hypothetical protein NDN08_007840 [Rhodosorus marinus]|uniref:Pinin/SDK/MemA protein domain-containing protein n=1 Tax=Rhodosorus marinus TaxID=101924 RepID=A0AAV8V097_9RHOD|nr:hypothetical protein NDN08_007840 [Rhodosorus marinus]